MEVTKDRLESLQHHKKNFAHDIDGGNGADFKAAIGLLKPSVIIGVSAMPNTFDEEVCEKMASLNAQPIICALSNPTSKAECTAEQAYLWTNGSAIFSSGSPFAPVTLDDGRTLVPGQGNNAYIFPGIGLGRLAAGSTRITNHDMYLAAKALSEQVSQTDLQSGTLYPPLSRIREVSAYIAVAIAKNAHDTGVATEELPDDMMAHVKSLMYDPFEDPYAVSM